MTERITGHTELIGLMAYPIRHSSSPAMHNEAFATLGLDYAYLAFEVDNSTLEDAVKGLRALKMVGSNVSMPNKTVVGQYLDELSPAAQMCGAVNTIGNDNGKLIGHITDGIGYMQSLKDNNIEPAKACYDDIVGFISCLNDVGIHPRSQSRIISAIRGFYKFMILDGYIEKDPCELIETPSIGRDIPEVLSVEEIDRIIAAIDPTKREAARDNAIIEVLYGCGLRVSELTNLKFCDIIDIF